MRFLAINRGIQRANEQATTQVEQGKEELQVLTHFPTLSQPLPACSVLCVMNIPKQPTDSPRGMHAWISYPSVLQTIPSDIMFSRVHASKLISIRNMLSHVRV
jgi:hypothetical protein